MPKYLFSASLTESGLKGVLKEGGTSREAALKADRGERRRDPRSLLLRLRGGRRLPDRRPARRECGRGAGDEHDRQRRRAGQDDRPDHARGDGPGFQDEGVLPPTRSLRGFDPAPARKGLGPDPRRLGSQVRVRLGEKGDDLRVVVGRDVGCQLGDLPRDGTPCRRCGVRRLILNVELVGHGSFASEPMLRSSALARCARWLHGSDDHSYLHTWFRNGYGSIASRIRA